jgi:hypothetical protein
MVASAQQLDDWGIAANICHLQDLDEEISTIDIQIGHLQEACCSKCNNKQLCEQHLEASRCAKQLVTTHHTVTNHMWFNIT